MARPPAGSGFSIVPHIQRRRATPGVHKCTVKTRSHFRFFKTTYWRCARKCKVGLLETLGNYCALQYAGRCCGKQHRKPDIKNWALKPGVLRVGELVDVGSGMCAWRCRRLRAAPGDRCRADAACKFLARAPIKGAALLWFGDTRLINTPVHAADERRVECSLAHEQSGVGGGAVLELFDG